MAKFTTDDIERVDAMLDALPERYRVIPPSLLLSVMEELVRFQRFGSKGRTLLVQGSGGDDRHVRCFLSADGYHHVNSP
jgi:hypothetical protein